MTAPLRDLIASRVRLVIARITGLRADALSDNADICDHVDTLDLIEIVMEVEEEFGIEIEDSESELVGNVGDLVKLAERKIGAAANV
ncbi:MAG: acpP [Bradyrhizobium sp.]|nr:acpP [Bradyrhizobium sp.]